MILITVIYLTYICVIFKYIKHEFNGMLNEFDNNICKINTYKYFREAGTFVKSGDVWVWCRK